MILPPPSWLTSDERSQLELVDLPAPEGWEATTVYRLKTSGVFIAEDNETADLIREAFPDAKIRMS